MNAYILMKIDLDNYRFSPVEESSNKLFCQHLDRVYLTLNNTGTDGRDDTIPVKIE